MSAPYEGAPPLTPEQQEVVDLPADAMTLVVAGAGAGKTHTLIRRLDALIEHEGLSAGETLVLSFSRAAVRELRGRLDRHADAARHVRVRTFDSWALELLTQVDAAGEWQGHGFDERIKAAAELIGTPAVNELYEDLRHVVIDEVQDLVGDRRELVEALLDTYDCGFTVVGDPAQGIYGFQVDPAERAGEVGRFFDWLHGRFGEDLTVLHLTRNFRATTDEAKIALPFGPRLQVGAKEHAVDGGVPYEELRTALLGTLLIGDLSDGFVLQGLQGHEGTTAVLCRTNGQALLLSEALHAGGVPHRVQRSATDRVVPAWLAELFSAAISSVMPRSEFVKFAEGHSLPAHWTPEELWRILLRAVPSRADSLDLGRLRTVLAERRMPDELTAPPASDLVVSSVHRAKGLEFDRVLVVDPGPLRPDADDPGEESRMLYVALTRPRHELMHLATPKTMPMFLKRTPDNLRWGRYHVRSRGMRLGLEFLAGDVNREQPAGAHLLLPDLSFDRSAEEIQRYLLDIVRPGDEVVLVQAEEQSVHLNHAPRYLVMHNGSVPIGITSEQFAKDLYAYQRWSQKHVPESWPRRIVGVHVDAIETTAGSQAASAEAGLGERGVWVVPRLVGLSRFDYSKTDAVGGDLVSTQ
ncbi:ATP-dependent helicase [Actinomadura macrotermitis]|uniref:ATP-dependent DNA helicase Rep n=1 Tax=Actinomadura macrotermitis TaxID=2585200 RepID=A0A7K0BTT0_9ACTN|nr:ATP-dependent helicase [Actinomadura macrotermitis]MQY04603.1 ATP-dependent DNA helicase Rep [Actinomadura macrotermitis]